MLSYVVVKYVLENLALLYGDFGMNSYSGNDDEAMKN
jgi:hypothetical protein